MINLPLFSGPSGNNPPIEPANIPDLNRLVVQLNSTTIGMPSLGIRTACLGDSIMDKTFATVQTGGGAAGQFIIRNNGGFIGWLRFLASQRIYIDSSLNFAHSGDTLAMIAVRTPACIAAAPSLVIVNGGTNDLQPGTSLADMISTWRDQMVVPLLNAGIMVLATPIWPRTGITTAQTQRAMQFNNFVREFCYGNLYNPGFSNIFLCDPTPQLIDSTSASNQPLANYFYDGLHPSAQGGYWGALPFATAINGLLPVCNTQFQTAVDYYDATNNPTGNTLRSGTTNQGLLAGTSGTATTSSGFSFIGTSIATGFTVRRTSGTSTMTADCTKENPRTDGFGNGERQKIVIAASTTGGSDEIVQFRWSSTFNLASGDIRPGNTVFGSCGLQIGSLTNCTGAELLVSEFGGAFGTTAADMAFLAGASVIMPSFSTAQLGVLRTEPFTVQSDSTSITYNVNFHFDNSGSGGGGTFFIADCALRKTPQST